jgi:hypothetical protein
VKREEKERKLKGDKTREESSHQEISTRKQRENRENIKGVHHSFKKDLLRKQPPLKEYAL